MTGWLKSLFFSISTLLFSHSILDFSLQHLPHSFRFCLFPVYFTSLNSMKEVMVLIFFNLFLIEGKLLYNVVLVSAIQQWESVIIIHPQRRQWYPTPVLLPGKSHGWRSLVGCSPWGHEELDTPERLHFHFSISCIGERNGNPLQYPCLENPRDGRAWWAAVCGVTQIRTRLKWLSIEYTSSLLGLLLPISPSHPPRSSQSARLGSLCYLFMTISYPPCLTQCLIHDIPPNIFFK